MKKYLFITILFTIAVISFTACEKNASVRVIEPAELASMMENKDFTLIDVHVPKQEHIKGTDMFIPFDEILSNTDKLPADKNTKIVLYCRSGNMSMKAANDILKYGYTAVYDLKGGKNSWDTMNKKRRNSQ